MEDVFKIKDGVLIECTSEEITEVIIPNNVSIIGEEAFRRCSNLVKVTMGNSVTKIEAAAFRGCSCFRS